MGVLSALNWMTFANRDWCTTCGKKMNERQKRSDECMANAVERGINILAVRNRTLAHNYMQYKRVPAAVIARVLDPTLPRRTASAEQAVSEALIPLPASDKNA
ncbi:hypothetical protein SAMN05192549_11848 [Duganella sacchari]|uniref:Uncharacterized protein n=1 Tax=Duganella sacchari TaxID=551987 RepID=A0A1M7RC46_9BURK|nr:hypothetical protein [Duganella sacchari]SHN43740.1 hypothetical protein SAMN05192549_11848 [Duganella sacchari]